MPVEGLLGFRTNRWNKDENGLQVTSPSYRRFEWTEGIVWAECSKDDKLTCVDDEDGHIIPHEDCLCGMYGTIDRKVLKYHARDARHVVFLCEAMGEAWVHSLGWRSSGALAVAIVNTGFKTWKINKMAELEDGSRTREISNYHLSMFAAAEYFKLPIIEWDVALEMVKIQWQKFDLIWPFGKYEHMYT